IFIYKIVKFEHGKDNIPFFAAAAYFAAPTVMLNSSYWGQVDSIYTFFLVATLYEVLRENFTVAMISFGIAFSTKAQAVFLIPFLAILVLQRKIQLRHLVLIPL